jgi:hypothetical protein
VEAIKCELPEIVIFLRNFNVCLLKFDSPRFDLGNRLDSLVNLCLTISFSDYMAKLFPPTEDLL